MDWPVACPSFRLSLSYILPPLTLFTLGVPYSSIDDGGAAALAAGSLDRLIVSTSNDLDPQFLILLHKILSSQSLALSLLALRSQQLIASLTATINTLVVGLPTLPLLPAAVLAQLTQPSIPPPFSSATSSVQTNRFSLGQHVYPVMSTEANSFSLGYQVHPVTPDPIPFLSPPSAMSMTTGVLASSSTTMRTATPTNGLVIPGSRDETTFSLTIGHRQIIRYKYSDIREPHQISFATNIIRLDRVWDDESLNWDPIDCAKNLLQINGTAIALRYWQKVFSGKKNRYVAECYRSRGPEDFWQEFSSTNGEHFHWKAITDRLRELHSAQDKRLVDRAKAEYGDFSQVFVNNRGKLSTMTGAVTSRTDSSGCLMHVKKVIAVNDMRYFTIVRFDAEASNVPLITTGIRHVEMSEFHKGQNPRRYQEDCFKTTQEIVQMSNGL
ncbi:hypothetical protein EV368DRAFT_69561 [Lentinula lateritia]|nr:hypothetical protein EV368DRAFT_69561 [Lentinula lateritia]